MHTCQGIIFSPERTKSVDNGTDLPEVYLAKVLKIRENCWQLSVILLCQLLVLQPGFAVQTAPSLRIVIVEGAGARNVIQQISARPIIVRIEDQNGQPVSGASVEFRTPQGGP